MNYRRFNINTNNDYNAIITKYKIFILNAIWIESTEFCTIPPIKKILRRGANCFAGRK